MRTLLSGALKASALCCVLTLAACGSDAKTVIPPDGGVLVRGDQEVGDTCTESLDCVEPLACAPDLPGGYCLKQTCDVAMDDCPAGSSCRDFDNGTFCLKSCDGNAATSDCRTGYTCQLRDDSEQGVCLPDGSRVQGDDCGGDAGACAQGLTCVVVEPNGTAGICREPCTPGNDGECLEDGFTCWALDDGMGGETDEGVCLPPGEEAEGSQCGPVYARCRPGLICNREGDNAETGFCRNACDPTAADQCAGDEECLVLEEPDPAGNGVCAPPGMQGEGADCGPTNMRCEPGLRCIVTMTGMDGEELGVCRRPCDLCGILGTVCGDGLTCAPIEGDDGGVCLPPPGNGAFEDECNSDTLCGAGLICFKVESDPPEDPGECLPLCFTDCDPVNCEDGKICHPVNDSDQGENLGVCVPEPETTPAPTPDATPTPTPTP